MLFDKLTLVCRRLLLYRGAFANLQHLLQVMDDFQTLYRAYCLFDEPEWSLQATRRDSARALIECSGTPQHRSQHTASLTTSYLALTSNTPSSESERRCTRRRRRLQVSLRLMPSLMRRLIELGNLSRPILLRSLISCCQGCEGLHQMHVLEYHAALHEPLERRMLVDK